MTERGFRPADRRDDLLTAIGLLVAAVLVFSGYLLYQAVDDRSALLATIARQEEPLQQAQRVKRQLDALATGTAKLAAQGDAGATQIIDGMKQQGITIKP